VKIRANLVIAIFHSTQKLTNILISGFKETKYYVARKFGWSTWLHVVTYILTIFLRHCQGTHFLKLVALVLLEMAMPGIHGFWNAKIASNAMLNLVYAMIHGDVTILFV